MELQVGVLSENISWLKWCVKGKAVGDGGLGLGLGLGQFLSRPLQVGQVSGQFNGVGLSKGLGPTWVWREKHRASPDISVQGCCPLTTSPIRDRLVPAPAQKGRRDHPSGSVTADCRGECENLEKGEVREV